MPEPKSRRMVIATICFDGKVRVWMVTMKERDQYDKQGFFLIILFFVCLPFTILTHFFFPLSLSLSHFF